MNQSASDRETTIVNRTDAKGPLRAQVASQTRSKRSGREKWKARNQPNWRTPVELKYFVLSLAALVGLGVGWLAGNVISGGLRAASSPLTLAKRAAPPPPVAAINDAQIARSELTAEAPQSAESVPADAAEQDANSTADTVTPPAFDATQSRAGRSVARRAHLRRQARGNFFFRPFRALRRLGIW